MTDPNFHNIFLILFGKDKVISKVVYVLTSSVMMYSKENSSIEGE